MTAQGTGPFVSAMSPLPTEHVSARNIPEHRRKKPKTNTAISVLYLKSWKHEVHVNNILKMESHFTENTASLLQRQPLF